MPPNLDNQAPPSGDFEQIVDRLKSANNILVTVSTNPTVDQFAACIGLTLVLNKLNKHANAVFSGNVPSTIDFLKPEETIEKNTDSLRDFIIALDKSKADKLRYKVENDVVKIFITPYRTSISDKDLQFSQGDFNIDAIVGLGVQDKNHLDAAILAHGRILHDATVISINVSGASKLGAINWLDAKFSSLCEMVADIAKELSGDIFDKQNATALLTGIVAETERYSNEKAGPHTMAVAGMLMSAGASTQLVSTQLETKKEEPVQPIAKPGEDVQAKEDGVISIDHGEAKLEPEPPKEKLTTPAAPAEDDEEYDPTNQIEIDETGSLKKLAEEEAETEEKSRLRPSRIITQPPKLGGQLTANDHAEPYTAAPDPLSALPAQPVLNHDKTRPKIGPSRASGDRYLTGDPKQTLSELEESIGSSHVSSTSTGSSRDDVPELGLIETRRAVENAANDADIDSPRPQARNDVGSQPFDEEPPSDGSSAKPPSSSPPPVPPPFVPKT